MAILGNQPGCTIKYEIEQNQDGNQRTAIYVEYERNGKLQTDPLKQYLEEQIDESLHECIRGNVLLAMRYFFDSYHIFQF